MPAFYLERLRNGLQRGWHMLLPPTCLFCGGRGTGERDLCAGCAADLPRNSHACHICATPLMPLLSAAVPNSCVLCQTCQSTAPNYDRAFAPFRYQAPLDYSICQLKFNQRLAHARLLGALFAEALSMSNRPLPDCLIPIPLHSRRLRERGFNQSVELARPVAQRLHIPLHTQALERVRYTVPQTQLDARARQHNLRGAFVLKQALDGQRVALFDDVMTTSSTVNECAKVLRAGAVREIQVWVIARAGESTMSVCPTVTAVSAA